MGQMFSQVLGMGAAAIPRLRSVIEQTGAPNGSAKGAARTADDKAKERSTGR